MDEDEESGDLLVDRRLKVLVDSYKRSMTPQEKSIYKVIFGLMYADEVKKLVM